MARLIRYGHAPELVFQPEGLVTMGVRSYAKPRLLAFGPERGHVEIGNYSSVNHSVEIFLGGNHASQAVSTFPFPGKVGERTAGPPGPPTSRGPVVIGNDAWIGWRATILSGLTIADGAVIAAHSMVTRDVPPYALVAGNPATVKRYRFEPDVIAALLRIRWWDWDEAKVEAHSDQLVGDDVSAFVERHDPTGPCRPCGACA